MSSTNSQNTEQDNQPFVGLQRIYIKKISYDTPSVPQIFKSEWKPEIQLNLNSENYILEKDVYEVVLSLIVTTKSEDNVAFTLELKQAGIFTLKNLPEAQIHHLLNATCPGTLYPYAREAVTDLVNRGSFPQLLLTPINFDVLYAQKQDEMKSAHSATDASA